MNRLIIGIVGVIIILATTGITYVTVNYQKDREITNLENEIYQWYINFTVQTNDVWLNLTHQLGKYQINEQSLVGQWSPLITYLSGRSESLSLYSNGTCEQLDDGGIWHIDNNKIIINLTNKYIVNSTINSSFFYCYCSNYSKNYDLAFLIEENDVYYRSPAYRIAYYRLYEKI